MDKKKFKFSPREDPYGLVVVISIVTFMSQSVLLGIKESIMKFNTIG